MIVRIHKHHLEYFRKKARQTPNEIYAVLVGKHLHKGELQIHYIIHPKAKDYELSTPSAVQVSAEFMVLCEQQAAEDGFYIVGSIHTHPNWPPILSPTDHAEHVENGDKVTGVVEVTSGKTRVAFWRHDTSVRCTLEYF